MFDLAMPQPCSFKKNLQEVTNERCTDLLKQYKDRTIYVQWSGGTDSTLIVAALLKNTCINDRKKIVIACNKDSVFEYPFFYFKFIEPNFEVIELETLQNEISTQTKKNNYVIVDGFPADQLVRFHEKHDLVRKGLMCVDVSKNPDTFVDYYVTTSGCSRDAAAWWYQAVKSNIDSMHMGLNTMGQWLWWNFFNSSYVMVRLRSFYKSNMTYSTFKDSWVNWYHTPDYQSWAMANHEETLLEDIYSYKSLFKNYIYELTNDEWYRHFKQKSTTLSSHNQWTMHNQVDALTSDGTKLYIETDRETILELLPDHKNQ